jgi:hypothetical protein
VPSKKEKPPLSVTHPELAKQADGWDPNGFTSGSGKEVNWRCQAGHKYSASISHRTNMNSGCPYCAGKKVLKGFNDFESRFPLLAEEADGWDPAQITFGSGKKVKWKCPKGHSYVASIANRTQIKATGCPVCANKVIQVGFNDLASQFPEVAKQAKGWDPTNVIPGSPRKLLWQCDLGHQYLASPSSRTSKRSTGCPICTNRTLLPGFNDLLTTHPTVAVEAFGWEPSNYFAGSPKKLMWVCTKGHTYMASISNRTSRGSGCPVCSGKIVLKGFNDLATKFPKIAAEAHGWDPSATSWGTHQKKSWLCPQGHIYLASISHRTSKDSRGCSICAGKQIQKGFNDLSSRFPEIAMEADGWDPELITSGIDAKMNWKCPLGHRYSASVGSRTNQNTKCPICANVQLLTGFNDLKTKHPLIAEEADGWDPASILAGSKQKMKWKCSSGHNYHAWVSRRTTSNTPTGCPKCGKYGFDSTAEGFLYLLKNSALEMNQIGITNNPDRRLREHSKMGWELIDLRGPMDGNLAAEWETSILRMLKAKGVDLSNSKIAGKFDGYSEAWSKSTFNIGSIKELMKMTEEFEEAQ